MHTARCCDVGTSVLEISAQHRNSKTTTTVSCSRLGQCRGCSSLLLYLLITISVICPRVSHATSAAVNYSKYVTLPHKLSSYLRCSLSVIIIMSCHCSTLLLIYLFTGPKYPPYYSVVYKKSQLLNRTDTWILRCYVSASICFLFSGFCYDRIRYIYTLISSPLVGGEPKTNVSGMSSVNGFCGVFNFWFG